MGAAELRGLLSSYLQMDGVLIILAAVSWWLLHKFVFKRFAPYPGHVSRPLAVKFATGLLWGTACLLAVILLIWAGGGFSSAPSWRANHHPMDATAASAVLLWSFFAAQSLFEELLFRALGIGLLALLLFWMTGVLFAPREEQARLDFARRLWFYSGLVANIVVAVAFTAVHIHNPHFTLLAQVNIALAGLVLGQLFWLQGSPWGAWGWHWIWNAGMASLGLPVSGVLLTPALTSIGFSGARAGLWSGGAFGPEGSLACSVVLALFFYWLLRITAQGVDAAKDDGGPTQPHSSATDTTLESNNQR